MMENTQESLKVVEADRTTPQQVLAIRARELESNIRDLIKEVDKLRVKIGHLELERKAVIAGLRVYESEAPEPYRIDNPVRER